MAATTLITGHTYDNAGLELVGWAHDVYDEGYDCWAYFDADGRYLGPDQHGVEPLFAPASLPPAHWAATFRRASDLDDLLQRIEDAEQQLTALGVDDVAAWEELRDAIAEATTDLPSWGPEPEDTEGVASWDHSRALVQADDWHLVPRADVEETTDAVLTGDPADVIAMLPGTQAERAERIGVTQGVVSDWAGGRSEMSRLARYAVLGLLGLERRRVGGEMRWAWR
jgi:hypothetical protein